MRKAKDKKDAELYWWFRSIFVALVAASQRNVCALPLLGLFFLSHHYVSPFYLLPSNEYAFDAILLLLLVGHFGRSEMYLWQRWHSDGDRRGTQYVCWCGVYGLFAMFDTLVITQRWQIIIIIIIMIITGVQNKCRRALTRRRLDVIYFVSCVIWRMMYFHLNSPPIEPITPILLLLLFHSNEMPCIRIAAEWPFISLVHNSVDNCASSMRWCSMWGAFRALLNLRCIHTHTGSRST